MRAHLCSVDMRCFSYDVTWS